MKATSGISFDNAAVAATPKHLLQFAVDQRYDDYTPVDHAVWRFIMRQNVFFLKEYAHKVYFQGLLDTGISFERIPRIQEMNDILAKIEWGAVAVDGFIPPAAFMEFQAYKVLVIACDMRQIHHIEYTPAPDIVHEAAGHAPIIVDREYSRYLQRFGEVGAKAMSSKKDFELYQAIRHLSILKEQPNSDPKEVEEATKLVEHRQKTLGEPSEMALLSRLHWWTVEYGLIGALENPKIYGAGLLSSIGESVSCLEPAVKKIPYSVDAANTPFDITTKQPQLFVCHDFKHLADVLEEFASKMAYQVGGLEGIHKAIECNNVATCEYSSGLQVSGIFTEVVTDEKGQPIYLRTTGKTALAFKEKELALRAFEKAPRLKVLAGQAAVERARYTFFLDQAIAVCWRQVEVPEPRLDRTEHHALARPPRKNVVQASQSEAGMHVTFPRLGSWISLDDDHQPPVIRSKPAPPLRGWRRTAE